MPNSYDVAIVGGSLAGSTAAHILGSLGYRIALIDKANFPRRKPCGEGLSNLGLKVLERQGLLNDVLALPHLRYEGYQLVSDIHTVKLKTPWGGGLAIQRESLDHALLMKAASHSSVDLFLGAAVTEITDSGVLLGNQQIQSNMVIIADGAGGRGIRGLDIQEHVHRSDRAGVSYLAHGKFVAPQTNVTIIVRDGVEVFCTPHAKGDLNISILGNQRAIKRAAQMIRDKKFLQSVFKHCSFEGDITGMPLGRVGLGGTVRELKDCRVFLLGDAKEQFDPVGGMGMTHALCSAEFLTQAIREILDGRSDANTSMAQYERNRSQIAKPIKRFTNICYHSMKAISVFPRLAPIAVSKPAEVFLEFMTQGIEL